MGICTKCGSELKEQAKFCKSCGTGQQDVPAGNEAKKQRVLAAEKRSFRTPLLAGIAAVVVVAAVLFIAKQGSGKGAMMGGRPTVVRPAATAVTAENGVVRVPASDLQGNEAKYYVLASGGKEIKFFLLKASDGTVRAALDACNACYRAKLGYHQQGDEMVCNNCGMKFRSADIGIVKGGCNPIPLEHKAEGSQIIVKVQDLEDGAKFF